jgi:hypothetical protein
MKVVTKGQVGAQLFRHPGVRQLTFVNIKALRVNREFSVRVDADSLQFGGSELPLTFGLEIVSERTFASSSMLSKFCLLVSPDRAPSCVFSNRGYLGFAQ